MAAHAAHGGLQDLVGHPLSHYRVLGRLGRGGMGEVFLAEDLHLGRRVALKVLAPKLAAKASHVERFEREARSVAALNHPNIVAIHAVEHAEGLHFLVLEWVEGETLMDLLLARGPFPLEELLDVALALSLALEAAHARDIVHRDLKPRNVMVNREGRVKVLDFGVARIADETPVPSPRGKRTGARGAGSITRTGVILGTPHYMAPEQILGRPVDPRADLFSLGILLFELATGRRPFEGVHRDAILDSILSDTPVPARSLRPELPPRFDEILSLCLAKEPFLRYRSAAALRERLTDLATGHGEDLGSTRITGRLSRKSSEAVSWHRSPLARRLPATPRCLGREAEVEELVAALGADPPCPVPVLGPAGAGKSTLTLAALHHPRITERFGKRRFFVRCDGATSRDSLVAAIALLVCPEARQPLEPQLLLDLEGAPAVLALDNLETPWEQDTGAVEDLLAELAAVPGLALVAALRGEQRPFGPEWREAIRVGPLDSESARSVFLAVAGERFRDDPGLDPLLLELNGLALAIVLLASQAEGEPNLSGLQQRWREQRTALLRRGKGREKQNSLDVSLQLSIYSPRMSEEGLRLLCLLGLLPDGAACEDLEALQPGSAAEAASVLRKVGLAFDQASRLRVLAPVREYVQASLPPRAQDFDRMVDCYLALARIGERIGGEGGAEAADRLRNEMGNLEPMILAGLERSDPVPAIHSALAYAEAVRFTGIGGLTLIGCARQAAQEVSQGKLEADCLRKLGDVHLYRAHYEQARSCYEQAREIYRQSAGPHGEACCTTCLAEVCLQRAQLSAATELYEEGLHRFRELGDPSWEARCLLGLGCAAAHRSEKDSRSLLEQACALFRQVGDARGEANCLRQLGQASSDFGDFDQARTDFESARQLFHRVGSLLGEAACWRNLGHIAIQHGEAREAPPLCERALAVYRRLGSRHGEANCLLTLGEAALALAEWERAEDLIEEARQLFQGFGETIGEAHCAWNLGEIAASKWENQEARAWYEAALRLYEQIPRPISIGRTHVSLAKIAPPGSPERCKHIAAARRVWAEAGLLDHLQPELDSVPVG